jgi:arylsulfatase A-like enzyme
MKQASVVAAWALVLLVELVLAWQGLVRPTALQVLLEVVAIGVVCAAQLRLARKPWQASAWWPGVLAVWVNAAALGPDDRIERLFFTLGTGLVAFGLVHLASRKLEHPVITLPLALLGALAGRWLVLDRAAQGDEEQFAGVMAVADATERVQAELGGLFRGQGEAGQGPPLVLITVDTLRWDHAVEMESFQRIAARGQSWDRAVSTASWTLPAMTSVHTGLDVQGHGAGLGADGYRVADPALPMLAEQLDQAGYRTAAFVTNSWLETAMGFDRGFDLFLHSNEAFPHRLLIAGMPDGPAPVDGAAIVGRALDWLDEQPERGWFLWVHLVDPHMPYFNAVEPIGAALRDGHLRGGQLTDEAERAAVRAAYANEVAYTDQVLLPLVSELEDRGVFDSGLVLMTADHGEEFWDHGGTEHGHSHHSEVVEVALALGGQGVEGRGIGPASLRDVAPTLLGAAGLPAEGVDLRSGVPADRVATAWGNNYYRIDKSARTAERTVIVRGEPLPEGPRVLAYDRVNDPRESSPLEELPEELVRRARALSSPSGGTEADLNMKALEALGYVEGD